MILRQVRNLQDGDEVCLDHSPSFLVVQSREPHQGLDERRYVIVGLRQPQTVNDEHIMLHQDDMVEVRIRTHRTLRQT
jgi:hypothetical protein